jgi:hypothetical protein
MQDVAGHSGGTDPVGFERSWMFESMKALSTECMAHKE